MWVCTDCFHENKNDLKNCENCGKEGGRDPPRDQLFPMRNIGTPNTDHGTSIPETNKRAPKAPKGDQEVYPNPDTSRTPQVPQIIIRQNESEEFKDRLPIPSGLLENLNKSVTGGNSRLRSCSPRPEHYPADLNTMHSESLYRGPRGSHYNREYNEDPHKDGNIRFSEGPYRGTRAPNSKYQYTENPNIDGNTWYPDGPYRGKRGSYNHREYIEDPHQDRNTPYSEGPYRGTRGPSPYNEYTEDPRTDRKTPYLQGPYRSPRGPNLYHEYIEDQHADKFRRQTMQSYAHADEHNNNQTQRTVQWQQQGQSKSYQDELPECEICLQQKKSVPATSYCRNCNERYCDKCTEKHKTMKQTSGHEIVNSCSVFRNNCDPCKHMNKVTEATTLCEDCIEFLCENCTKFHSAEKKYKEHKVTAAPETLKCIICQSEGKDIPAVCYCESCLEDAEPFCENCAEHHTAMKINRDHTLSHNMAEYLIGVEQHKHTKPVERVSPTIRQPDPNEPIIQTGDLEKKIMRLERPYVTEGKHKSDQIDLKWIDNDSLGLNEVYQVQFKDEIIGKWQIFKTTCSNPSITISGLKAATVYTFRIRIINEVTGEEGSFSEISDSIKTGASPAMKIKADSKCVKHDPIEIYRLPIVENGQARNEVAKTRKFSMGDYKESQGCQEKTLMVVGATGSGKSTLINALANYVVGVTWEDDFRFTLINLEETEREKQGDQAISQTEWVTCYTIYANTSSRIDYTINVIDTPGFGDTRGLEQDARIVGQIRELFTSEGVKGVDSIDAICFILKAPDARLTVTQKYIFDEILSLFGKDIRDNICTLITFADGQTPPVLAAVEAFDAPLPHEVYYTFNNSALFVDNRNSKSLSQFFWDMGVRSCTIFFDDLPHHSPKSLILTAEVLTKRQMLENTIHNLQLEIDVGLSKINELEDEINLFTSNKKAIQDNKDFEYVVNESRPEKIDISGQGRHTTHCLICNYTCHDNCVFNDDKDKKKCVAIDKATGNCTQCPQKCNWGEHKNLPFVIKWSTHKVRKTYAEKQKIYQEAKQKKVSLQQVLHGMHQDVVDLQSGIQERVEEITEYTNRLKEIALRPDPLSTVQYIELLIESEKREMKNGYIARIDTLQKCKKRAEIGDTVNLFEDRLKKATQSMMSFKDLEEEKLSVTKPTKKRFWDIFKRYK